MKRSIYFPDELYARLEKLAEKKNISVASLIRLILTEYISRNKEETKNETAGNY